MTWLLGLMLDICLFFERVTWGKPRIEEIEEADD